ncbi:MAG: fibrillarin-like rRNA/tRNA 2'-O-methyltransferase [Candidatus Bathyarchaeia archaeon]
MVESIRETYPGVYFLKAEDEQVLATKNLVPGRQVYGEPLYRFQGSEYRSWNPTRSKVAAAIQRGLKSLPIRPSSRVLYLGAASGTTVSHVSDIIGLRGHVWAVEFSARPMRDLIERVSKYRMNVSPILADARDPWKYETLVGVVDVIFADIAQPKQAEIFVKNAEAFLRERGRGMLSIKSRSIDVSLRPEEVYESQVDILEDGGFEVEQLLKLDPFEKDHALALGRYIP